MCREAVLVNLSKIVVIVYLLSSRNVKQLWSTLVHTGYYRCFIRNNDSITAPLDQFLKKTESFVWTPTCEEAFHLLKEKMVSAPILMFPDWTVEFHVHIDSSHPTWGRPAQSRFQGSILQFFMATE